MPDYSRRVPCQAVGCASTIKRGNFLCRPHWFSLPAALRQHVNDTWRKRRIAMKQDGATRAAPAIVDHVEACDEGRRLIAESEGRLAEFVPDATRIRRLYAAVEAQQKEADPS